METVLTQLERLRRHHAAAIASHDDISLLDLSHILRIWTELKEPLVQLCPSFSATMQFKAATPPRRLLRAIQNHTSVIAFFPGGVRTYANGGHLVSLPQVSIPSDLLQEGGVVKAGGRAKINLDRSLEVTSYISVVAEVREEFEFLEGEIKRLNYARWLDAEAVRIKMPGEMPLIISREMIVKRMANTLDGSHASVLKDDVNNRFDAPIHRLLGFKIAGLSLPYLILLKIAQDILDIAPKLLK